LVSFAWPLAQQAQVQGIGEALISPARGDIPAMNHELQGVVYTTQDEIDRKHAAMAGFVRGYAAACTTIRTDAARSRKLLTAFYQNLDPKALDLTFALYRATSVPSTPLPDRSGFARAVAFHRSVGLITENYRYDDLVATQLISEALRRAAGEADARGE
ncbi:MAG TPA: hypothetical protein VHT05_14230, partial [Candidatus Elarobacter sp.]|nr:hypothetical protein [Candidatus Elarobacter sp.]